MRVNQQAAFNLNLETKSQSRNLPASDLISHNENYAFKRPSVFNLY